jgi:uncharacterized protein YcaQ
MPKREKVYSLAAVRALALHSQRLASPLDASTKKANGPEVISNLVEAIGCVQIDTLHMVHRSQYLALWSRLGAYDVANFDRLIYQREHRSLYEYWQHAACIIPLKHYRYSLHKMNDYRNPNESHVGWARWLADPKNTALLEQVRQRIRQNGSVRGGDFEYDGPKRGSWWDWKPAKIALEYLYDCGELMIADRVKFQRVYDLKERVLPEWVDTSQPTEDELNRHRVDKVRRHWGSARSGTLLITPIPAVQPPDVRQTLIDEGTLIEVKGEVFDGEPKTLVVHRDNLPLLKQAADGALKAERTTFLSPFDSLFWAKRRDMLFWNFFQTLEAYTPEPKRRWGYFCLPILHKDRLVGRFDPKLERKTGTLRLKALHLEPGIQPDEELIADVAAAMRDFMAFHHAKTLTIERSNPPVFAKKLLKAM